MDEAAYIDGAGYFRIFISIVLPLCKSALVVVGMFSFLFYWNDFFSPMIYLENYKNYTIALGLQSFVSMTPRRVNYYCAGGRIPGAVKMAGIWLIPKDAEKPIDMRTKQGKGKI